MKSNYHTHTLWCDGKNTPEEFVAKAIEKGFVNLGFSSHSMLPSDDWDWVLTSSKIGPYRREILSLADKYKDRINVFLGIEADYVPGISFPDRKTYEKLSPEYIIGSVHFVKSESGALVPVDHTPEILAKGIAEHFGGSVQKFIRSYFAAEREMVEKFDFDIVGHVDLVRKFNARAPYFSEKDAWYLEEIEKTAESVAASGKLVEINTGAISRKWMKDAYPSEPFFNMLSSRGVKFVLGSDAHSPEGLDESFDVFSAKYPAVEFVPERPRA